MSRLVNLDFRVFDEVRSNPAATLAGLAIVAGAMLCSGIGGWLWWIVNDYPESGDVLINSALLGSALAFFLWGLWVVVAYLILQQVFRQRAYMEQLLRVMGLAAAPMALSLLMFIPVISFAIGAGALALTFALTLVAIKSVTTADLGQCLAADLGGFLLWAAALTLLSSTGPSFTPHAPGVFLYNSINTLVDEGLSGG